MDTLVTSLIIASSNVVCYDSIDQFLELPSKLLLVKLRGLQAKTRRSVEHCTPHADGANLASHSSNKV